MNSRGHGGKRAGAGRPPQPGRAYDAEPPHPEDDPAAAVRWCFDLAVEALDDARRDPKLTAARRRDEVAKLTRRVAALATERRRLERGWPCSWAPDGEDDE